LRALVEGSQVFDHVFVSIDAFYGFAEGRMYTVSRYFATENELCEFLQNTPWLGEEYFHIKIKGIAIGHTGDEVANLAVP